MVCVYTSALRKFRATDLNFRDYMLDGSCRSGGPERLVSIGQASRVIYVRCTNNVLFNSGGLGTLVEESTGREGYVMLLLA